MDNVRFVHIVDEVPELPAGSRPVMLVALDGFLDAGNASARAVSALLGEDAGRVVASFDVDEFHDYRARRPAVTFAEDHYRDYEAPRLVVRLLTDLAGMPYLLLAGPEPDIRWEAFGAAVRAVVERFEVRVTLSLGSVPMAVPHTRPINLTAHANTDGILVADNVWKGEIRIPSSAQTLLELRLGEWGHAAGGFVAHIPHYVAQYDYPEAAAALLDAAAEIAGLAFDTAELRREAQSRRGEIDQQVEDSDEIRQVVSGLEQQYDAFHHSGPNLLADDVDSVDLPTGEELGAQFEEFLAGLDPDGGPGEEK